MNGRKKNSMPVSGLIFLLLVLFIMPDFVFPAESQDEKKAFLGVSVQEVARKYRKKYDLKRGEGVLITHVTEDSPADFADIEFGDIILSVNGSELKSPGHLNRLIRKKNPGDKVTLQVIHDGKRKSLKLELSEYGDFQAFDRYSLLQSSPGTFSFNIGEKPYLGVYLQELNEDLAGYFKVDEDAGVLITEVEEDSPAEAAGIKPGDILAEIDDEEVRSPEDATEILSEYDAGDEIDITVIRSGGKKTMKVELDEPTSGSGLGRYFFNIGKSSINISTPKMYNGRLFRERINSNIRSNINRNSRNFQLRLKSENNRTRIIFEKKQKDNLLYRLDEMKDHLNKKLIKVTEDILKIVSSDAGSKLLQAVISS